MLCYIISATNLEIKRTSYSVKWGPTDGGTPFRLPYTLSSLGGDPAAGSPTAALLRLLPPHRPQIRRTPKEHASSRGDSDGATGGVCKERGRIHRAMMTRDY